MGGVDRCDQLRGTFSMEKAMRSRFWYKKLFLGIFGVVLSNAFVLWRSSIKSIKSNKCLHFEFYNGLTEALLGTMEVRRQSAAVNNEARLNAGMQHFLVKVSEGEAKGKRAHDRCVWCKAKGSCSCDVCHVFLCSPSTA